MPTVLIVMSDIHLEIEVQIYWVLDNSAQQWAV